MFLSHASEKKEALLSSVVRSRSTPSLLSLSLLTSTTGHRQDLGPLPRRRRPHVRRLRNLPRRQRRAARQGARCGGRARCRRCRLFFDLVVVGAGLDLGREATALFPFFFDSASAAAAADGHQPPSGDALPGRRRRLGARRARAVVPAARRPQQRRPRACVFFFFASGPRGALLDDAAAAPGPPHGRRGGLCRRGSSLRESPRLRLRPGERGAARAALRRARRAADPGR